MGVFLWMLREVGVKDVPSFTSLREIQSRLRTESGIPTRRYESTQGNVFFMNDVQEMIARVCDLFRWYLHLTSIGCTGLWKSSHPSTPPLLS